MKNLNRESYKVWPENLLPHSHTQSTMGPSSERSSSKLSSHWPWPTHAASFGTYHFRQLAQTLPSSQWRSFHCLILFWKIPCLPTNPLPICYSAGYALSIFLLLPFLLLVCLYCCFSCESCCLHFCFLSLLSSFGFVYNFVIAAKWQRRLTSQ